MQLRSAQSQPGSPSVRHDLVRLGQQFIRQCGSNLAFGTDDQPVSHLATQVLQAADGHSMTHPKTCVIGERFHRGQDRDQSAQHQRVLVSTCCAVPAT